MIRHVTKLLLVFLIVLAYSCTDNPDDNTTLTDNFDRAEMLAFWADDIIIPTYTAYTAALEDLSTQTETFYTYPSEDNLSELRFRWLVAYLTWQEASMFEIGKAEELGLRNFTNIYPTNVELIRTNIDGSNYNLTLPSNFAAQGFPALDYLLYGLGTNDIEIIELLTATGVEMYFRDLVERLNQLSTSVLEDWDQEYREAFIVNSGSSGTASTDKMVNDFLFYYERFLRAAKVGIPAGIFTGNEESDLVEGRYSKVYSKQLFEQGFSSAKAFFTGQSYDGTKVGNSLKQYLNEIHESNATDFNIGDTIIAQWDNVELPLNNVGVSFEEQVLEDNSKMLALYDELQKAVVPLKVDMLQALNIQVDFVDADGD